MSPIVVWIRTHRAVLGAASVVVAAAAVITTFVALATSRDLRLSATTPMPSSTSTSVPTVSATPGDADGPGNAATRFAQAWMSYRWDDSPQALASRVQPYVTERLYAGFAASGGAPGLASERAATHEVARAVVTGVYMEGPAPDERVGLVVTCAVTVTADTGTSTRTQSAEVFAVKTGHGWRVDEVTA